jgi:hypothetical protein
VSRAFVAFVAFVWCVRAAYIEDGGLGGALGCRIGWGGLRDERDDAPPFGQAVVVAAGLAVAPLATVELGTGEHLVDHRVVAALVAARSTNSGRVIGRCERAGYWEVCGPGERRLADVGGAACWVLWVVGACGVRAGLCVRV